MRKIASSASSRLLLAVPVMVCSLTIGIACQTEIIVLGEGGASGHGAGGSPAAETVSATSVSSTGQVNVRADQADLCDGTFSIADARWNGAVASTSVGGGGPITCEYQVSAGYGQIFTAKCDEHTCDCFLSVEPLMGPSTTVKACSCDVQAYNEFCVKGCCPEPWADHYDLPAP